MKHFSFRAPTQVIFGEGSRHRLHETLPSGRWGLLSSPSVRKQAPVVELLEGCEAIGVRIVDLGDVSPNPRLNEVERGLAIARGDHVKGVLAIGGGSVIDAAKLLRLALQHDSSGSETLRDLGAALARPSVQVRLCAVPTTAGTGAEVSRGAIITDEESGAKVAVRGNELIPDMAVIDPELTLSLPRRRTAETGFDVIAHAIETYLSRVATPVTDILALAALAEVPTALIAAVRDGGDCKARRTLSLHAWLMGYNLAHASTCLPHRMQYPIGAATDTSHQIGLAAIYPAWLRYEATAAGDRLAPVSDALGAALGQQGADIPVHEVMTRYLEELGMHVALQDLGLGHEDVDDLARAVNGRTELDPLMPDEALIATIYRESVSV